MIEKYIREEPDGEKAHFIFILYASNSKIVCVVVSKENELLEYEELKANVKCIAFLEKNICTV